MSIDESTVAGVDVAPPQSRLPFESFEDFWTYYLGEHASPLNRSLHVAGAAAALGVAALAIARRRPRLLLLAPVLGYVPAWIGHFLVERNRPATLHNPLWSIRGDLRMLALAITGRLNREHALRRRR